MDAATLDAIRREVEKEVKEGIPGVVRVIATVSVKRPKVAATPEDRRLSWIEAMVQRCSKSL